jgi:hypothetical protein
MYGTRIKQLTGHSTSRYLVVGISAFGADYALLLFAYYVVGLPLAIATTIVTVQVAGSQGAWAASAVIASTVGWLFLRVVLR